MLFLVTWDFTDSSEAGAARSLKVFQNWQPAQGAEFKGFYGYADGSGGVAVVEVDSAATLARLTAPFIPWLRFNARPILPVEEAAAISGEALAFLGGIS
jgi:hypothetical protein